MRPCSPPDELEKGKCHELSISPAERRWRRCIHENISNRTEMTPRDPCDHDLGSYFPASMSGWRGVLVIWSRDYSLMGRSCAFEHRLRGFQPQHDDVLTRLQDGRRFSISQGSVVNGVPRRSMLLSWRDSTNSKAFFCSIYSTTQWVKSSSDYLGQRV